MDREDRSYAEQPMLVVIFDVEHLAHIAPYQICDTCRKTITPH